MSDFVVGGEKVDFPESWGGKIDFFFFLALASLVSQHKVDKSMLNKLEDR